MRKTLLGLLLNSLIVASCFYLLIWVKTGDLIVSSKINFSFLLFYSIWLIVCFITKKQKLFQEATKQDILSTIAISNIIQLIVFGILIRYLRHFYFIRFVIIYALLLSAAVELLFAYLISILRVSFRKQFYHEQTEEKIEHGQVLESPVSGLKTIPGTDEFDRSPVGVNLTQIIIEETNDQTFNFIKNYFSTSQDTLILSTTTRFNIFNQPKEKYSVIINLKRINDVQYINKFFEAINSRLDRGGIFIDWVEIYSMKKKRILTKYATGLNYLLYSLDFIFFRVFPKLPVTKKLYFFLTKGRNRVLSKAEAFGRLYSCGFEIIEEQYIDNRLFFVVSKVQEPAFDNHPTYGPFIRLRRIGKNGKIISVYKLRTMHAFSEYLQAYIHDKYSLQEGGKFKNDFRITTLGRIFRKLWIDELPMLINLLKGDLKLVGVRPLSQHYFNLYTEEFQNRRLKYKPGLIPPFYVDLPKTLDEVMSSEIKYLNLYDKHPIRTDIVYLFKAGYNIIFRHARSA
jgi:lipopolysaccharide/colanic/teichoic acid biosynthesis glycosyltransferase